MRFELWTRAFWVTLVYLAYTKRDEASTRAFLDVWDGLRSALPCDKCRINFRAKHARADARHTLPPFNIAARAALVLGVRNAIDAHVRPTARRLTLQDQRAFATTTAGEAERAFAHVLMAVTHDWAFSGPSRRMPQSDHDTMKQFVKGLCLAWPNARLERRGRAAHFVAGLKNAPTVADAQHVLNLLGTTRPCVFDPLTANDFAACAMTGACAADKPHGAATSLQLAEGATGAALQPQQPQQQRLEQLLQQPCFAAPGLALLFVLSVLAVLAVCVVWRRLVVPRR